MYWVIFRKGMAILSGTRCLLIEVIYKSKIFSHGSPDSGGSLEFDI